MLDLTIKTIPHSSQRYETVGDYVQKDETWGFSISDMKNADYEFLVAVHELIEWYLTQKRGIEEEDITAFDTAYESRRPEGDTSEPGDSPDAPYRKEHQFATEIEKRLAEELGVQWEEYDKAVNAL